MAEFMKPRITALSYSRFKAWERCPKQAMFKYVQKLPEPDNIYAKRGTELHSQAEEYLNAPADVQCPPALTKVGQYLNSLKYECPELHTELKVAFNRDWDEVDWFGPTVFLRAVYDAIGLLPEAKRLILVDHKSGKERDEHDDQLELYAMSAFHKWLDYDIIHAKIFYIDQGTIRNKVFERSGLSRLHDAWDPRLAKVLADEIFAPNPGRACNYCHFRRSNGGPCTHG